MPKPTELPRWATDETNNAEPAEGTKDTGWVNGTPVVSTYFNWWQKLVYDWIVFLDSANLGDLTVDTLTVEIDAVGDGGGPLPASGGVDLGGDLFTSFSHTLVIQAPEFFQETATHTAGHAQWILAASANYLYVPIRVRVGDRITSFRVRAGKNTTDTNELGVTLFSSADGTDAPEGDAASNADDAPGFVWIGVTDQEIDVVAGRSYHLRIEPGGGVAPAADRVYLAEIGVSHPQ